MNERIRELAKEAGITTNLDTDYFVNDPDSSLKTFSNAGKWVDYFSEKFAELIVRECIGVIGDENYNMLTGKAYCTQLKRHFGVEK